MPVTEEGRKGLKSDGEVGSVPSDANPSGPTSEPKRKAEIKGQYEARRQKEQQQIEEAERRRQEEAIQQIEQKQQESNPAQ